MCQRVRLVRSPVIEPVGGIDRRVVGAPRGDASRLHVVDGLRGLAAVAVAWFHFTNTVPPIGSWLRQSGTYGWLGVEIFFVISGFIIPYSMRASRYQIGDYGRFLAKRMLRLYPPFAVAVFLMIALDYLGATMPGFRGEPPTHSVFRTVASLTYLASILNVSWVGIVFWSLAIEVQFYLLMGLLFVVLNNSRFAIVTMLVMIGSSLLFPSPKYVFHFLPLFAAGSAVFLFCTAQLSRSALALILAMAILAVIHAFGWAEAVAVLLSALVILLIHRPVPAPLVMLGAISYSVYLIHVPIGGRIVNLGSRFVHGEGMQLLFALAGLALTLAAGWVFYRLFERSSQRLSSRIKYKAR
jgi:peptidoglycan/LPS O-acetylase OafA/YrhL